MARPRRPSHLSPCRLLHHRPDLEAGIPLHACRERDILDHLHGWASEEASCKPPALAAGVRAEGTWVAATVLESVFQMGTPRLTRIRRLASDPRLVGTEQGWGQLLCSCPWGLLQGGSVVGPFESSFITLGTLLRFRKNLTFSGPRLRPPRPTVPPWGRGRQTDILQPGRGFPGQQRVKASEVACEIPGTPAGSRRCQDGLAAHARCRRSSLTRRPCGAAPGLRLPEAGVCVACGGVSTGPPLVPSPTALGALGDRDRLS